MAINISLRWSEEHSRHRGSDEDFHAQRSEEEGLLDNGVAEMKAKNLVTGIRKGYELQNVQKGAGTKKCL